MKKFKINYTEKSSKTSIVFAKNKFDARDKFENNEDEERVTISSFRYIENLEKL